MEAGSWFWIFGWFVTTVAVIGNTLVIYLIAAKPHLHKKPNWFILSLATADLFVAFTYIPPFSACWNWFSCSQKVWFARQTIQWLFLYASVSNLFVLTVDRYIALTSPLKHKRCLTPSRIALLVFTAWFIPIIFRICIYTPVYLKSEAIARKYLIPLFLVMFEIVPCIVLPCFTFHMVHIVRKHRKTRQHSRITKDLSTELRSSTTVMRIHVGEKRRRSHNINVVVCVVVVFIICYSVNLYTSFCNLFTLCSISQKLWYVRHLLLVTNSALNPIAYAIFKYDIMRAILALGRCQSNNEINPSSAVN